MFIEYNLAKSMCLKTTLVNEQSPDASRLPGLKYLVGKAGRFIGQNAVQLHGGMGMTEDLMVAHYFKRLTVIDALFGHTDLHLDAPLLMRQPDLDQERDNEQTRSTLLAALGVTAMHLSDYAPPLQTDRKRGHACLSFPSQTSAIFV